jgi:tRNA(His) guanylyltransferase
MVLTSRGAVGRRWRDRMAACGGEGRIDNSLDTDAMGRTPSSTAGAPFFVLPIGGLGRCHRRRGCSSEERVAKEDLDRVMRAYETAWDMAILPGVWPVVRLDGRAFHRLTAREDLAFQQPFDRRFRDWMLAAARQLMVCGFRALYAHIHSDEISVLLHCDDDTFGRRTRKVLSVLAGEASARFSLLLGEVAAFDARISQLPTTELVVRYFHWRQVDAHRNALHGHCYWALRREGLSAADATARLLGASVAEQNELLFRQGINYNDLPAWHRRGVGIYWQTYTKAGRDPRTGETTQALRRRLFTDLHLPVGDAYATLIRRQLGVAD